MSCLSSTILEKTVQKTALTSDQLPTGQTPPSAAASARRRQCAQGEGKADEEAEACRHRIGEGCWCVMLECKRVRWLVFLFERKNFLGFLVWERLVEFLCFWRAGVGQSERCISSGSQCSSPLVRSSTTSTATCGQHLHLPTHHI